jgi:uncharacterized protein YjbI with pentapeptide repeats
LAGAVLAGAVLAGAVLAGAVLAGAVLGFIGRDFLRFLAGVSTSPSLWVGGFFAEGLAGEGTVKTPGSLAAYSI